MIIGVPKETRPGEARVAMVPEVARKLVGQGFSLRVERGAGLAAGYHDEEYEAVGSELVDRARALAADLVLKVRKPTLEEVAGFSEGALCIGFIETCDEADETLKAMFAKGIQPLAMERIPRISRAQSMDALSSQSNIAGYRAVIEAAARYGRFFPLMMTSAGSVKPAEVIIKGKKRP